MIRTPLDDPVVQHALEGPKTGLTFTLLSRSPATLALAGTHSDAGRLQVYMNIEHANGRVRRLSSVTVDATTGTLTQATAWRMGDQRGRFLDAERCEVRTHELPTGPILLDVLADTIGPLTDPLREGFVMQSDSVVERDEGPVIQRITNFASLTERKIEYVSTRDGAVRSSIVAIRLTDSFSDLRPHLEGVCPALDLGDFVSLLA